MTDMWTDRLSDYLDQELTAPEREALEAHLPECSACTQALDELRGVAARAGALEDRPPSDNLWPGIAARIAAPGNAAPRRLGPQVTFTVPQLVAAAAALVLLTAGGMWLALPSRDGGGSLAVQPTGIQAQPVSATVSNFDAAVVELQRLLDERRDQLDSATIRVLEENLAVIDQAIAEARAALSEDPANAYLNQHLATTMWRKVHLLQRAATLTGGAT
jgi:anti-sigma factor RsiW